MSQITDKQDAARLAAAERKKADAEAMRLIAKHFSSPEGKEVFDLLARRFGLLTDRFQANDRGDVSALKAALREGETRPILFILRCLREAGAPAITMPL